MDVICFGLSLPLTDHEIIKDCVNLYCEWLSVTTSPKISVPKPIIDDPNIYTRKIIGHLHNLFVPRHGEGMKYIDIFMAYIYFFSPKLTNVARLKCVYCFVLFSYLGHSLKTSSRCQYDKLLLFSLL
jgi:hypothetical protein